MDISDNLDELLNDCDTLLRDAGSRGLGSMVSVPEVRNKFLKTAWDQIPNGNFMEVEKLAKVLEKEMFENPLLVSFSPTHVSTWTRLLLATNVQTCGC